MRAIRLPSALSVLVLAAAVAPAAGQDVTGPTVTIKAGRLASVPVTVDADEVDYVVLGEALDGFREYDASPKKLRIRAIGYTAGTGYVVVSAQKGGKLVPLMVVTVKVVADPGPAPVPPVPVPPGPIPPTPPAPADPLVDAIRAAAKSDALMADGLRAFASAFQSAADLTRNRHTGGELQSLLTDSVRKAVPVKPPATWAVLARQLAPLETVAPAATPDKALSAQDQAAAVALFTKLALACQEAAK